MSQGARAVSRHAESSHTIRFKHFETQTSRTAVYKEPWQSSEIEINFLTLVRLLTRAGAALLLAKFDARLWCRPRGFGSGPLVSLDVCDLLANRYLRVRRDSSRRGTGRRSRRRCRRHRRLLWPPLLAIALAHDDDA